MRPSIGRCGAPVVALTANALDDDRRVCMEAGFDAYLAKPFEFRELAETIERVCAPRAGGRRTDPSVINPSGGHAFCSSGKGREFAGTFVGADICIDAAGGGGASFA